MNKEKEIKDICKLICATCAQFDGCAINCKAHRDTAEALYNAGYRKTFTSDFASDTQKAYKEGYEKGFNAKLTSDFIKYAQKQAVKEFVERLKEQMGERDYMGVKYKQGVFSENDIDELLKEYEK